MIISSHSLVSRLNAGALPILSTANESQVSGCMVTSTSWSHSLSCCHLWMFGRKIGRCNFRELSQMFLTSRVRCNFSPPGCLNGCTVSNVRINHSRLYFSCRYGWRVGLLEADGVWRGDSDWPPELHHHTWAAGALAVRVLPFWRHVSVTTSCFSHQAWWRPLVRIYVQ